VNFQAFLKITIEKKSGFRAPKYALKISQADNTQISGARLDTPLQGHL